MIKRISRIVFLLMFTLGVLLTYNVQAQCPMCKANVESAMKAGNKTGKKVGMGLNAGILTLLSMPYAVFGIVGVLWYRNSRYNKKKRLVIDDEK
jgi:hypothetical protein